MNTILIESNRTIADAQYNQSKNLSQTSSEQSLSSSNANWSTTIDSGILLNPGDQITLESAALNLNGAGSGDFQQFNGAVDTADINGAFRKDNAVNIEIAYYTTNCSEFNFPLPSGKHTCELNSTLQGTYGAPSFTGRRLWRPTYEAYIGNTFQTVYAGLIKPQIGSQKFYFEKEALRNGPETNQQNNGGFFFVGMDYNVSIPVSSPTGTASSQPAYAEGLANGQAWINWLSQTNFQNTPGVQYGQALGPVLPLYTAPYYETGATAPAIRDPQTLSSLNLNVSNINNFTNSGFFNNGKNGGANPLLLLAGDISYGIPILEINAPAISSGATCMDINEWDTGGPVGYSYQLQQDPSVYKGSCYNSSPNQNKLYQPKKDDVDHYCRGPYYDLNFQNLMRAGLDTAGDASMNGMTNLLKEDPATAFWTLQKEEIKIQLATGNIAPTRVSEIITETFKARHGNADFPTEKFFEQEVYAPEVEANRQNQPDSLTKEQVGGISSKCYSTFPTLQGDCLQSAMRVSSQGLGNDYGWDALSQENINPDPLELPPPVGQNFNVNQAKMKYWSNMLCGNPFEWTLITALLPRIQYRPFIDANVQVAGFNYKLQSVYTGEYKISQPVNGFTDLSERMKPDGTTLAVDIGEFGDMPCLLDDPNSTASTRATTSYDGLWWLTDGTAKTPGANPSTDNNGGPWRLQQRPYAQWLNNPATPTDAKYKRLDQQPKEVLLTNIIFNGQTSNAIFDSYAETIKGHTITASGKDTLVSQSVEMYDNTFIKWKIGRLDDANTYPEQYIDDTFGQYKSEQGQKGVPQYLPNTYFTNLMFNYIPSAGNNPAGTRNNIAPILTNSSVQVPIFAPFQSNYTMKPTPMGIYDSTGAYTQAPNPSYDPNQAFLAPSPNPLYAVHKFGLPCYSFFKDEYINDIENTTGFKKVCERTINGFRYLPQSGDSNGVVYNANNAWNEKITINSNANFNSLWTTKPSTMPYNEFVELWATILELNNGKGVGWIPIFSKDPAKTKEFRNIPFLGVIYQSRDQFELPAPERGEYFMMGTSPSLSQNDLHLPHSTQQTHQNEWKAGYVGMTRELRQTPVTTQPNLTDIKEMRDNGLATNWATSKYVGCNDPLWSFDNIFNRYTYAKFHTSYFKGNGQFQYGNEGATSNPNAEEIQILGKTAGASKQVTQPHAYIGFLEDNATNVQMEYAETIFGNTIWDATNPGGKEDPITLTPNIVNPQYGSPKYATQWELKYMSLPGGQVANQAPLLPDNINIGPLQGQQNVGWITPSSLMPYAYIEAEKIPYPTISSQAGIGIVGLSIPTTAGTTIKLSNADYQLFNGTLFDKMGFSLNQFLPLTGKVQTELNHNLFNKFSGSKAPLGLAYHNLCFPITTQAVISSSLTPALNNGFGYVKENVPLSAPVDLAMPFYRLGMLIPNGATTGSSESMFAERLPQKLSFPYLVCRSNIMTPTNLQYIGGTNGQQMLPAIGYLMTNYATNDFFYISKSDLVFTVSRPYVLTEIKTSIHLPNGQLASNVLDGNSAVIYRIDFAKPAIDPQAQQKMDEQGEKYLKEI